MHKLAAYQLRIATREDGHVDSQALIQLMARTYEEFDRERRLTDRANKLIMKAREPWFREQAQA